MKQHTENPTHIKNLARLQPAKEEAKVEAPIMVKCEAYTITDPDTCGVLGHHLDIFEIWAKLAKFDSKFVKHSYDTNNNTGIMTIRHHLCKNEVQRCDGLPRQVCNDCQSIGGPKGIRKMVVRFAFKYWAAKLLNAMLFRAPAAVKEVRQAIEESSMYKRFKELTQNVMAADTRELQGHVRSAFNIPSEFMSEAMQDLVWALVTPCLDVNVDSTSPELCVLIARMSRFIATRQQAVNSS
jgi:hypothetical protein